MKEIMLLEFQWNLKVKWKTANGFEATEQDEKEMFNSLSVELTFNADAIEKAPASHKRPAKNSDKSKKRTCEECFQDSDKWAMNYLSVLILLERTLEDESNLQHKDEWFCGIEMHNSTQV